MEQGAKLLVNNSLDPSRLPLAGQLTNEKRKALTGKSRPRKQSCKIPVIIPTLELPAIETKSPERSGRAKIDEIGNKYSNSSSTTERIMLGTKISIRVYEPKTYKEAIRDPIHSKQWRDAIEKKIQNLENHQT